MMIRTLLSTLVLATALVGVPRFASVAAAAPAAEGEAEVGHAPHINWFDLGYKSKNVEGGELQEGDDPMPAPMGFVLINFGLLLTLLGFVAVPPIRRFVGKRHELIKDALEEAGRLREEARQKLDQYTQRIKDVEAEVDELIRGIRADAEAEKERIIAAAKKQAEQVERDAQARIAADIERARFRLEREVVTAAVAAAERILREGATPADQAKLVDTFLGNIGQGTTAGTSAPTKGEPS